MTNQPVKPRFYGALLDATVHGPATVYLGSIAFGLGCHASLLTRYVKEATARSWIRTERKYPFGGTVVEVLDRGALSEAAGRVVVHSEAV